MRGTPSFSSNNSSSSKHESDGDSIASTSSEDLESSDTKDNQEEEEILDVSGNDLHHLFQRVEDQLVDKAKDSSFTPIDMKEIPQTLLF